MYGMIAHLGSSLALCPVIAAAIPILAAWVLCSLKRKRVHRRGGKDGHKLP